MKNVKDGEWTEFKGKGKAEANVGEEEQKCGGQTRI